MATIRLDQETKNELDLLKKKYQSSSHSQLIRQLIERDTKRISMFGTAPGLGGWEEGDRER